MTVMRDIVDCLCLAIFVGGPFAVAVRETWRDSRADRATDRNHA